MRHICPNKNCGSEKVSSWIMGMADPKDGHSHDPNKHFCEGCGNQWFTPCPDEDCDWGIQQEEIHR